MATVEYMLKLWIWSFDIINTAQPIKEFILIKYLRFTSSKVQINHQKIKMVFTTDKITDNLYTQFKTFLLLRRK